MPIASPTVTRLLSIAAVTALTGCASPTPEQQFLDDAVRALGGRAALDGAGVLTLAGTGTQYNLGQDLRPNLADQTFTVSAYRREIDTAAPRQRTTQTRTPNFSYFQGPQAQTQIQGVDGEVAYNVGADGKATRAGAVAAADRRAERLHHPVTLLRTALQPGATLSTVRTSDGERAVDVTTDEGPFTLVIGGDGAPLRIESPAAHPNLGDVRLTTTFADYAASGSLRLPGTLKTLVDDFTTGEYTVSTAVAASGSVEAPAEAKAAAAPAPPAPNVAVQELAPGVWFLAGQSHHSVVVAFADRLVLIEAPQSEARTQAVLARARELRPGVPLTQLVMSHHHFDHTAGLRAAIADGLTVVAHQGNEAFVKAMAARPFTRQPDALAKAAKPITVETVADSHTITDGRRSLVLYPVEGNPHSETMLMAYLPSERLLVEVDAFSPGGTYHPYAANLLERVEQRKLRVDRIVPLHGAVVPFKDLVAAAKSTPGT